MSERTTQGNCGGRDMTKRPDSVVMSRRLLASIHDDLMVLLGGDRFKHGSLGQNDLAHKLVLVRRLLDLPEVPARDLYRMAKP